jgi:fructose-1,6-bisphosphatase/inositol monophosphatase family enzyme/predicted Zn-dependent protease
MGAAIMSVNSLNAEQLLALEHTALAVVQELATLGLSFFKKALAVEQKADGSLVSEADRALELLARECLARLTPDFGFVGEEFGSFKNLADSDLSNHARRVAGVPAESSGLHEFEHQLSERPVQRLNLDEDTYWILDPIDGTINFLSKTPLWSVLLALIHKGKPVLGCVALPALDEVFVASSGHGARYGSLFKQQDPAWRVCRPSNIQSLSGALISYSTPKTFAYRGIESFLPILHASSRECRTHSDAYGYTRVLIGAVDLMVDPLVAPYDVAALQVLFDETPGAVLSTLHSQKGDHRYRMGSVVAAASSRLLEEFFATYRGHLANTADAWRTAAASLSEPLLPENFRPTFDLSFDSGANPGPAKVWARALETAVARFVTEFPAVQVEDVSILAGTRESASRAFSNGRDEGPPEFHAATTYHIRAIVSGAAGLVTGTPGFGFDPVDKIYAALCSARAQLEDNESVGSVNLLAAREQLISHVGQHPWKSVRFAEDFRTVSGIIKQNHELKRDERLHSVKTRLNMAVEYRWQYFLDSAQQTFVSQVCRVATNATCAEESEKRTAYGRYLKNHFPSAEILKNDLAVHFMKVTQQSLALLPAALVPEAPEYDFLAVDADLLGLILHEAIGHAAEGDLIQTCASGFGESGVMRELEVGPDWLDILIDGTLDNCGYLPVDAEGVVPSRKLLVRNGKLIDAIHTRHTAKRAGKTPDGCARTESLQYPSLNRMTSIWVCPTQTKSIVGGEPAFAWDDLPPEVIQKSLEMNGYLDGNKGVLLLSGWKGGTASCSNLEFRADVARVLHLKKGQSPVLMREANFTGIATECFRSAVDAFGPTLCRSIGTCGKDGQGVLTSDGGPAFMVFKPNSKVRVIGTGENGGEE